MYFSVAPMRPVPTPSVSGLGAFGLRVRLPRVVPLRSRYGATPRRGMGQNTGEDIINQWSQVLAPNNPFILNNPSLAQNAASQVISELQETCNDDPSDPSCSGGSPLPSLIQQANAIQAALPPALAAAAQAGQTTPIAIPNTTTYANPGPVLAPSSSTPAQISGSYGGPPAQPVTVSVLPVVTLSNQTNPGQPFQVGDSWILNITGAPNQSVVASANFNGSSYANNTPFGSTDSTGKFSTTGTFTSSQVGNWSEVWSVGGVPAASITFSVVANSGPSTVPPATTAPAGSTTTAGATGACPVSFFSGESCLGGMVGSTTALVIGGVLVGLFLLGGHK
jgi:hypothetical protein